MVAAIAFALAGSKAVACSWAVGYFHQVTDLRGTVVGSSFPVLHLIRWYRQSVPRPRTKLTLYDYCWPCGRRNLLPVKTVLADQKGKFDFGPQKPGHYYLDLDDQKDGLFDEFEVEVVRSQHPAETETIDISPVYPDCSGGHEFTVRSN